MLIKHYICESLKTRDIIFHDTPPDNRVKDKKMKRKLIFVLSLLVITIVSVSCVITSRDIHVDISCDDFTKNPTNMLNNFQMEIGDKIYVGLCSNRSTGFEWSYEMSGDTAVKEEDHDFEEPENSVPGAAGKETWTFEAIEKGTSVINLIYSQPWEGGIKGEWKYKIEVFVN
jgi:predicted secreted protein